MGRSPDIMSIEASAESFRLLVGSPGADGHCRTAEVVAWAGRAGGLDVAGPKRRQTADEIIDSAEELRPDAVCLTVLCEDALDDVGEVAKRLRARCGAEVYLVVGGIVTSERRNEVPPDVVAGLFDAASSTDAIVQHIRLAQTTAHARGEGIAVGGPR